MTSLREMNQLAIFPMTPVSLRHSLSMTNTKMVTNTELPKDATQTSLAPRTPTTIISTIYKSEVSMLPMVSQAYKVETVMARA